MDYKFMILVGLAWICLANLSLSDVKSDVQNKDNSMSINQAETHYVRLCCKANNDTIIIVFLKYLCVLVINNKQNNHISSKCQ
jgi:hypothetical protein